MKEHSCHTSDRAIIVYVPDYVPELACWLGSLEQRQPYGCSSRREIDVGRIGTWESVRQLRHDILQGT